MKIGIDISLANSTYTPLTLSKEELDNYRSFLCSFGIPTEDEELDLPSRIWIPELHIKCPYKQSYIAGVSHVSLFLTEIGTVYGRQLLLHF